MIRLAEQFSRFFIVGCGSAVGHYGLLILLVSGFGVDAVLASIPASVLGAAINYLLNYRFTFKSEKLHREAALKFSVIAFIGIGFNTFFMWVCKDLLGFHYLIAQLIATGLVMVWGFLGNRFWTFRVA